MGREMCLMLHYNTSGFIAYFQRLKIRLLCAEYQLVLIFILQVFTGHLLSIITYHGFLEI